MEFQFSCIKFEVRKNIIYTQDPMLTSSNLLIQNYIFGTKDIVVLVGMDL